MAKRGASSEDQVARLVDSTGRAAAEAEERKEARVAMEVREVESFIFVIVMSLNRWNLEDCRSACETIDYWGDVDLLVGDAGRRCLMQIVDEDA